MLVDAALKGRSSTVAQTVVVRRAVLVTSSEIRKRAKRAIYSPAKNAGDCAARSGPLAGKMRPLQDDNAPHHFLKMTATAATINANPAR
jgi:hypothetical protein